MNKPTGSKKPQSKKFRNCPTATCRESCSRTETTPDDLQATAARCVLDHVERFI